MDEPLMTNEELNAWRMIGADMGLEFDELGHPYKPGTAVDQATLEFYQGAYDWRPLEDDGDCMGLVLHYRMDLHVDGTRMIVSPTGPRNWANHRKATMSQDPVENMARLRRLVFEVAAILVRRKLKELDSVNTRTPK